MPHVPAPESAAKEETPAAETTHPSSADELAAGVSDLTVKGEEGKMASVHLFSRTCCVAKSFVLIL